MSEGQREKIVSVGHGGVFPRSRVVDFYLLPYAAITFVSARPVAMCDAVTILLYLLYTWLFLPVLVSCKKSLQ